MAIRKLANGRLAIELQQHGKRIFRRLPPLATRADALAYETKIRRDLFAAARLGVRPEVALDAAIQLWLENVAIHHKDAHRTRLRSKQWAKWVEGRALREAPEVAKEATRSWMRSTAGPAETSMGINQDARSPATINRRLALLKAVCKWAWQQGMIEENLSGRIRMLRESGAREVYLTLGEVRRLAEASPSTSTRAAVWILAYTGLRVSELLGLDIKSGSRAAHLFIRTSKTGKPRVIPVPPTARRYLRALPLGLSYWQLHKEFLVARKRAGMPHVRLHDLRHTCAELES